MKQLFPKEIIENTVEYHHFKHTNRSKVIYALILISLVTALCLLPFIEVNIYTTARGIIKSSKESVAITPLQSGKVIYSNIRDNQKVYKGDTLVLINRSILNEKMRLIVSKIEELKTYSTDCNILLSTQANKSKSLMSSRYQKEQIYYLQKLDELTTRNEKTYIDLKRNKKLYTKGVIAKIDFEKSVYEYKLAKNALNQYKKQQRSTWQSELTAHQNSLNELRSNVSQLQQNVTELTLIAPIDGTLKNVKGLAKGSFITGGVTIAEISPDAKLIAECFIAPSDIGLINKHKIVNFQIDAFNYNQWGLATGSIEEISSDVDMINNQPVFKVKCVVDQMHLKLKNGFEGKFNKGMTLSARFQLTERTLFQLLYDKVDDWVNPASPTIVAVNKI